MSEPDERVERAYRALAQEEPPARLDAAILAASRRAVARPSFVRRWGMPVSLAAVVMLAVGVALETQHETPGVESAPRAAAPSAAGVESSAPPETSSKTSAAKATRSRRNAAPATRAMAPPPPEARTPAAAASPQAAGAPSADMATARIAPAPGANLTEKRVHPAAQPRDVLENIARLRAAGRDAEADRSLDEFRREFPDYRIDDATWARVKPR